MKENEKNSTNESVLKQVILEYEQVVNAAKNKLAENNGKELDSLIAKFLKESENRNEPFDKVTKEPAMAESTVGESAMIQKPIGETVKENASPAAINMKEASLSEVESAYDNAGADDDFVIVRSDDQQQMPTDKGGNDFDITSIEGEIDEMMREVNNAEQMQQTQAQQPQQTAATTPSPVAATSNPNDPMAKMKEMYEGMGKFLKEMEDMSTNQAMMNEFHSKMSEMYGESYKAQMDEAKIGELFSMYKKVKGGDAEPANKVDEIRVAEVAAPAVEEGLTNSLSAQKLAGEETQPRSKEFGDQKSKFRIAVQNQLGLKEATEKKMTGILKENLSLTKQLNKTKTELTETKGQVAKVDAIKKLNENYKSALDKYRTQLKEMAVLNTNISYVNNLLVNEGLALSLKDKEEIIEKFKKVGTILESETTYKKLLSDFSTTKKSIKESLEDKVNSTIVETSSANKLEESVGSGYSNMEKILRYSGIPTEKKQIV